MKSLLVRHKVEIPGISIIGTPNLTFHKWLPIEEPIISEDEQLILKIWVDRSNLSHISKIDIDKQINVLVNSVYVDVTIKNIDVTIFDLLIEKRNPTKAEEGILTELEKLVYLSVTNKVNRLIDYAKSVKHQYWLTNITINPGQIPQFNIVTKAKAILLPEKDNKWFTWYPTSSDHFDIVISSEESYISSDDWKDLKYYVNSEKRTNFKLELISRAFALNGLLLRTNALIDAVSALEIATSDFVTSPGINKENYEHVLQRLDIIHLKSAFDHLGFSSFLLFILPLILKNESISNSEMKVIAEALQTRNNIIHNGQRDIEKTKSIKYLIKIRKLIKILDSLTLSK